MRAYEWDYTKPCFITEEEVRRAKSLIGVKLRRKPHNRVASRRALVDFVRAIGDRNPLFLNEDYGMGTFWGTMLAHPLWLYTVDDTIIAPCLRGIPTIYAGARWEFERPVKLWDEVDAEARLIDVVEKEGRFCGKMILQVGGVVYKNRRGEIVARAISKVMRTPREEAKRRGKYMGIKKHKYTREELYRIEDYYDGEEIRGGEPRYLEDVEVGEELVPVVKGPLTSEDMLNFFLSLKDAMPLSLFFKHLERHPADAILNPRTGIPDSFYAVLFDDDIARELGFPYAIDTGIQRICWLGSLLTNWLGDHGFLKMLDVEIRLPNFYGDTTLCRGRVVGKDEEGVKFEVWCENQRGERTAYGEARGLLPKRRWRGP